MFVFKSQERYFGVFFLLLYLFYFPLWYYSGLREAAASNIHLSSDHTHLSHSHIPLSGVAGHHGELRSQSDISVSFILLLSFIFSVHFGMMGSTCSPHSPELSPPPLTPSEVCPSHRRGGVETV